MIMSSYFSHRDGLQFHIEQAQDDVETVKGFLKKEYGVSRRMLTALKKGGHIRLNDATVYLDHPLQTGDVIQIDWPKEENDNMEAQPMDLDIRYEDDHMLVLNKPSGLTVHPTMGYHSGTLANGVLYYFKEQGIHRKFRPVNRLDRDTSGLMIVAKHAWAHQQLSLTQQSGDLTRTYLAIVEGSWIKETQGKITAPIGRKDDSIIEREVRQDGQHAVTHWNVLGNKRDFTLLSLRLETGRTHQIRVHLSWMGYPLAGDDLYGGSRSFLARQALHAQAIQCFHPLSKKHLKIQSEMPGDMRKLWNSV